MHDFIVYLTDGQHSEYENVEMDIRDGGVLVFRTAERGYVAAWAPDAWTCVKMTRESE